MGLVGIERAEVGYSGSGYALSGFEPMPSSALQVRGFRDPEPDTEAGLDRERVGQVEGGGMVGLKPSQG